MLAQSPAFVTQGQVEIQHGTVEWGRLFVCQVQIDPAHMGEQIAGFPRRDMRQMRRPLVRIHMQGGGESLVAWFLENGLL
jgi:hypothetical protein